MNTNTATAEAPQLDRPTILAAIEKARKVNLDEAAGGIRPWGSEAPTTAEVVAAMPYQTGVAPQIDAALEAAEKDGELVRGSRKVDDDGNSDATWTFIPLSDRLVLDQDLLFQVAKKDLAAALLTISQMRNEVKLTIDDNRITMKVVDEAHVCMVQIHGTGAKGRANVGIDVTKLRAYVAKTPETVILTAQPPDKDPWTGRPAFGIRLNNDDGIQRDMGVLDVSNMGEPKIPSLNLPTSFVASREDLDIALKHVADVSDHLAIEVKGGKASIVGVGDVDSVRKVVSKQVDGEPARSLFSLDYFHKLVKSTPRGTTIRLTIGTDYPVRMEWSIGTRFDVTALLAPRVETEEADRTPLAAAQAAAADAARKVAAEHDADDEAREQEAAEADSHMDDLAEQAAAEADPTDELGV